MDISFWVIFQIRKKKSGNQGKFTGFKDLSIANHVDILPLSEVSNSQLKDLVEFVDEK
jgi:hypothetical protein